MKITLSFSDIEVGAGTSTDDFREEKLLYATIRKELKKQGKIPLDLVLNGDTFDFAKAPYKGEYPKHVTEKISLGKLHDIYKAHPGFFEVLHEVLTAHPKNRIIFIYGNHDFDLVFPKVQAQLQQYIAPTSAAQRRRILFPGFEFKDALVKVEHGSQLEKFFHVDPDKLIYSSADHHVKEPFLKHPWGFNGLYDYHIHIKEEYPLLEQLLPREALLAILPFHLKIYLLYDTLAHLLSSFFFAQFEHWNDPLFYFPPKEFYKYISSLLFSDFSLDFTESALAKLESEDIQVLLVGHNHMGRNIEKGSKRLFVTDTWRNEYMFSPKDNTFLPQTRSYAKVVHDKQKVKSATLIKVKSKLKPVTKQDILKEIAKKPFQELRNYTKQRYKRVNNRLKLRWKQSK